MRAKSHHEIQQQLFFQLVAFELLLLKFRICLFYIKFIVTLKQTKKKKEFLKIFSASLQ